MSRESGQDEIKTKRNKIPSRLAEFTLCRKQSESIIFFIFYPGLRFKRTNKQGKVSFRRTLEIAASEDFLSIKQGKKLY